MSGLATFNFKLSQIYPGAGDHHLNTCANPDCSNFGQPLTDRTARTTEWQERCPDLSVEQMELIEMHGPGAYKLAGAREKHRRVSSAFQFKGAPHACADQRTVKCLGQTSEGKICDSAFSIRSPEHMAEEIGRLRNFNGVLAGPVCGACGVGLLDHPDEFALDGVHERTKDRNGNPVRRKKTPTSLRVLHKPCRGKKGVNKHAIFTP